MDPPVSQHHCDTWEGTREPPKIDSGIGRKCGPSFDHYMRRSDRTPGGPS